MPATAGGSTSGISVRVTTSDAPAEPTAGDQVCRRRSDDEHGDVRDRARLEADDQGVASDVAPER